MSGLMLRPPTPADAPEITRVLNEHGLATGIEAAETVASVEEWFDRPELDPTEDMRVAVAATGALAGYADVSDDRGLGTTFPIDLRVGPGSEALAPLLLDAMEERARTQARPGAVLRLFVGEHDTTLRALAEARGYRVVRSSYRMTISLSSGMPDAVWPNGITPREFEPEQAERVYEAHQEAFDDQPGFVREPLEQWRSWNLGPTSDPSLWCVAWQDDEIAGLCINRPERGDGQGWVGVLGVRPAWRRRGLGRALLLDAFHTFRRLGRRRVGLGVDAENPTGALDLYRSVGMQVACRHADWERAL